MSDVTESRRRRLAKFHPECWQYPAIRSKLGIIRVLGMVASHGMEGSAPHKKLTAVLHERNDALWREEGVDWVGHDEPEILWKEDDLSLAHSTLQA